MTRFCIYLVVIGVVLAFLADFRWPDLPGAVDWHTIITLTGLLILTNDVALFILVPLTLTLRKFSHLPISRLIIFEALVVNAGSLLTPVGNPQNILLWSHGSLSVAGFIVQMLPLAVWLLFSLIALTWFSFSKRTIEKHDNPQQPQWQKLLFVVSVVLYLLFIAGLEWELTGWVLLIVASLPADGPARCYCASTGACWRCLL